MAEGQDRVFGPFLNTKSNSKATVKVFLRNTFIDSIMRVQNCVAAYTLIDYCHRPHCVRRQGRVESARTGLKTMNQLLGEQSHYVHVDVLSGFCSRCWYCLAHMFRFRFGLSYAYGLRSILILHLLTIATKDYGNTLERSKSNYGLSTRIVAARPINDWELRKLTFP